jgi:hypothetical protein
MKQYEVLVENPKLSLHGKFLTLVCCSQSEYPESENLRNLSAQTPSLYTGKKKTNRVLFM